MRKVLPFIVALAVLVPAAAANAAIVEQTYSTGNLTCDPLDGTPYVCDAPATQVSTDNGVLQIGYTAYSGHSIPVRVIIMVDGSMSWTSGWVNANEFTGYHNFGPVSPGMHTVDIAAEINPNDAPYLGSWLGTLNVKTSVGAPLSDWTSLGCSGATFSTKPEMVFDAASNIYYTRTVFLPLTGGCAKIYFANTGDTPVAFRLAGADASVPSSWTTKGMPLKFNMVNTIPLTPSGQVTFNDNFWSSPDPSFFGAGYDFVTSVKFGPTVGAGKTAHLALTFTRPGLTGPVTYTVPVSVQFR